MSAPKGTLLPRAKSWTTYAQFFLLHCRSNEGVPPIWEGLSEGTQKLRVLFSQTLCPPKHQQQGQSFTYLKPRRPLVFCEEEFSFSSSVKTGRCLGKWKTGEGVISHFVTHCPPHRICWQTSDRALWCLTCLHKSSSLQVDPGLKLGP